MSDSQCPPRPYIMEPPLTDADADMYEHLDVVLLQAYAHAMERRADRLQAIVDKLREAYGKAVSAADALRDSVGGHEHWDRTMKRGAGCPACIRQREGRIEAEKLLQEAAEAARAES